MLMKQKQDGKFFVRWMRPLVLDIKQASGLAIYFPLKWFLKSKLVILDLSLTAIPFVGLNRASASSKTIPVFSVPEDLLILFRQLLQQRNQQMPREREPKYNPN